MSEIRHGVYPSPIDDPYADDMTQPFWDAAAKGQLVGYKCTTCGTFVMPPQPFCFNCQNRSFEWVELPGTGTIYSFTVVRQNGIPPFNEQVPFVVALVDLEESGARFVAQLPTVAPEDARIGARVRVRFRPANDRVAFADFVPDV